MLKKIPFDAFLKDFIAGGLHIAFLGNFISGLCMGYYIPLISLWLDQGGYSAHDIGLVVAMGAIGIAVFVKKMPAWMHHLGLQRSFMISVFLLPIFLFAVPFTNELYQLYILRFIYGIIFGLFWLVSETWVVLKATKRFRGTYMSLYALLYSLGLSLGPQLLHLFDTITLFSFALGIFLFIPLLLLMLIVEKERLPQLRPISQKEGTTSVSKFFWMLPLCFLATFISGFVETAYTSLVLIYVSDKNLAYSFGIWMLSFFAAGNLLLQMPLGFLADRISALKLLKLNTFIAFATASLWPLFLDIEWLALLIVFLMGGAITGFYTIGLVLVGNHFKNEAISHANMVFILFCTLGAAIGPFIVGALIDIHVEFFSFSLALILGLFFMIQYHPKMKGKF